MDDPFAIDVKNRCKKIDNVLTKIVKDKDSWNDFFKDPFGTMSKAGLFPPQGEGNSWKSNRIFYSMLSNKDLMRFVFDTFSKFRSNNDDKYKSKGIERLKDGKVENDTELDIEIYNHILSDEDRYRKLLALAFNGINDDGLLNKNYSEKEINEYVKELAAAATSRRSLGQDVKHEIAEEMSPFIVMMAVPPGVGPAVVAEAVGAGTAVVVGPAIVFGMAEESLLELQQGALMGDDDSQKSLALINLFINFTSDFSEYLNSKERILKVD